MTISASACPQPVLVVTHASDDLGRHDGVLLVTKGGAIGIVSGGSLAELLDRVLRAGILVLARETTTSAAKHAIGLLCARARERSAPAVLLRRESVPRDELTTTTDDAPAKIDWPAHPVSIVADIPAWLWLDARGAWTTLLERARFPHAEDRKEEKKQRDGAIAGSAPSERRFFFLNDPGRLTLHMGDRRMRSFLSRLPSSGAHDGFLVPSLLDAAYDGYDAGEKLESGDATARTGEYGSSSLALVPARRAGGHAYTQAWLHSPLLQCEGRIPCPSRYWPVFLHDVGADMTSDAALSFLSSFDPERQTARALAAMFGAEGMAFEKLEQLVDLVVPVDPPAPSKDEEDGEGEEAQPRRARVLGHLLDELGHPPPWRRSSVQNDWDSEIEEATVVRLPDMLGERRVRFGFEDDRDEDERALSAALDAGPRDLGLDDEQICVVACDADADRRLPELRWRRPGFVSTATDPIQKEREQLQHAMLYGEQPAHSASDDACATETSVVPCDDRGNPLPRFHVVRYGDRLPRRSPACIVLLGNKESVARVGARLDVIDKCNITLLACTGHVEGMSEIADFPSFFDVSTFLGEALKRLRS